MTRIILDESALAKLRGVQGKAEICDGGGRTVGHFTPAPDRSLYEGLEIPITEEELRQAEQDLTGRPLKDILADLEKRG